MRIRLYDPSGCEERLLNVSSAGLRALLYFSSGAFSLLITRVKKATEGAGEGDKEKRVLKELLRVSCVKSELAGQRGSLNVPE